MLSFGWRKDWRNVIDSGLMRIFSNADTLDQNGTRYRLAEHPWISTPVRSRRDDVIFVAFICCNDDDGVADTIHHMPYLTSVYTYSNHLGDIQRDTPLFINTRGADIVAFLKHNELQFAETHRTFIYIQTGNGFSSRLHAQLGLLSSSTIVISFFGPTSGSLTLRLRHRASLPGVTLAIGDMTGSPTFEFPIPSVLTVDDITLHPRPAPPGCISFKQGTRNNVQLIVRAPTTSSGHYWPQDIQLLDEAGCPHNPSLFEDPDVSQASFNRSDPHIANPSFSEAHDDLLVPSTSK
jgi:hypothetical protein